MYLLQSQDEVFSVFESFHKMVVAKFNAKIQIVRSDNGGEYISQQFQSYLVQNGI